MHATGVAPLIASIAFFLGQGSTDEGHSALVVESGVVIYKYHSLDKKVYRGKSEGFIDRSGAARGMQSMI